MALIEKDVKTIEELKTVIGHGGKAAVLYDVSTGEPYGLDVEVLIAMDASIDNKVEKVAGKSLILDTEIARLATVTNQTKETLGLDNVDNTSDQDKPISTATRQELNDINDALTDHKNAKTNPHIVTKLQVGLGNVDNTSDLNKPVSTATQTALNEKVNTTDIEQVRSQATNKVASSKLLDDELTALENAVDAVTVDTLGNTQDIRSLENTINSANINQETTATVTGVDTVALPKTAANTGMQVQLFGQSAENLVVNGDFRNGTTGWTNISGTTSVANSILSVLGNDTSATPRVVQNDNLITGNVFYAATRLRVTNNVCLSLHLGIASNSDLFVSKSLPIQNEWYNLSGRTVVVGADIRMMIQSEYETAEIASGKVMEVAYAMTIDLTATFGAGNEPTKEQCDLLFANYFEGTNNVLGTGRIRSVNSSGLNPSYLYFNGGQLRSNGLIKDEIRKGTNGYELVKRVGVGTLGGELTVNSGAEGQTDWVDSNGDGLADGQSVWNFSPSGWVASIVTGNGFAGNAQRIEGDGHIALNTPSLLKNQLYFISFKYRSSHNVQFQTSTSQGLFLSPASTGSAKIMTAVFTTPLSGNHQFRSLASEGTPSWLELDEISIKRLFENDGLLTGNAATVIGSNIHYTLATPVITPIAHAGLLNSNSNGTAYFEPIIADAGVYSSNLAIQLTDYPIASFESIRKYANGTYTDLNPATAVIESGGLSFTHPDLVSGDLVMFTYAYNMESIGRSMTLTHYDSRFVEADTANGKVYRIVPVVTNGVVSWTAVEV